jgi:hypothetical protein
MQRALDTDSADVKCPPAAVKSHCIDLGSCWISHFLECPNLNVGLESSMTLAWYPLRKQLGLLIRVLRSIWRPETEGWPDRGHRRGAVSFVHVSPDIRRFRT